MTQPDAGILERVKLALRSQRIETPSWAYANSGTRFKVFPQEGCRVTRTRRLPTRRSSTSSPASRPLWRCTSRGTGSTTTPIWPRSPATTASVWARSTPMSSRTTTTSWAASPTRMRGAPQGHRPPARMRRHHGPHRLP
ncbi:hypothetical protein NKG94_00530 [Micromonospora sp. M12]